MCRKGSAKVLPTPERFLFSLILQTPNVQVVCPSGKKRSRPSGQLLGWHAKCISAVCAIGACDVASGVCGLWPGLGARPHPVSKDEGGPTPRFAVCWGPPRRRGGAPSKDPPRPLPRSRESPALGVWGGGRPAGVCAGHRCHRATQGPVRGGAACRPRSPSASRTRGQAQVDRLPRCRPVLPPEQPRGLPAVPCRIPAPSQSHLFTIRRPRDSEVTDRHRQRRSLRTRLALRLCVPPGPGHPVCEGPSQRLGAALPASASSVYATHLSSACHLQGALEVEEATPVGLCLSPR